MTRFCCDPVLLAQATYKRYQSEHKTKQDSLDRSQTDLKKLRRKSQGKHASKYQIKENEVRPDAGGLSGDWCPRRGGSGWDAVKRCVCVGGFTAHGVLRVLSWRVGDQPGW